MTELEDFEIRIPQPGEHYVHYKGGTYEVLVVGRLSEQRDEIMVVYRSLERGHVWIRPLGMWSCYVDWWDNDEQGRAVARRTQRFKRL